MWQVIWSGVIDGAWWFLGLGESGADASRDAHRSRLTCGLAAGLRGEEQASTSQPPLATSARRSRSLIKPCPRHQASPSLPPRRSSSPRPLHEKELAADVSGEAAAAAAAAAVFKFLSLPRLRCHGRTPRARAPQDRRRRADTPAALLARRVASDSASIEANCRRRRRAAVGAPRLRACARAV